MWTELCWLYFFLSTLKTPQESKLPTGQAKKKLESQGIEVLSPAENFNGAVIDSLRHLYMQRDIGQVLRADIVVVLPGWNKSTGAMLEVANAREFGKPVLNLDDLSEITERVVLSVEPLVQLREESA